MNTAVASLSAAPAPSAAWKQRAPLGLAIIGLFIWLLWGVSARQALLLLIGLGLGWGLARQRFGFTTAWRILVQDRDPSGVYGQIILIGLLAIISIPLLGKFPEATAALGPPSWSLLIGAFVFGAAMQVADGCGSGTLYKAGMGVPLNMAVLPAFIVGSFAGSAQINDWVALGAIEPIGLVDSWGPGGALAATLVALVVVALGVRAWTGRGFRFEVKSRHWLYGGIALAAFAGLNFLVAGQPWGIVYGFGLWGAKAATALGLFDPTTNAFYSDPGHAMRLSQTLLLDVTSITNIGILMGAYWVAARHPRESKPHTTRQWTVSVIAGFLLGYSSRLAFGCNIGAMVSGISTGSIHGWIWVLMAFPGSLLGLRIRRWLGY